MERSTVHLLHSQMCRFLLAFRLPRAPRGRLLLSDADQDDLAVTALAGCHTQEWLSDLLLVVAFGEVANGIPSASAQPWMAATYASPICPKAADDGILNPR